MKQLVCWPSIAFVVCLAGAMAAGGTEAESSSPPLYTACNIWFEFPDKIWSTGYQKGTLLPAGTEVTNVKGTSGWIAFRDAKTHVAFKIFWVEAHRPGVSLAQYRSRLLTQNDFAQLTHAFTNDEIAAIKAGEIRPGMSKPAVLVSVGYPPEVRTPSTDMNRWVFWRDRFRPYTVMFDDGKVIWVSRN